MAESGGSADRFAAGWRAWLVAAILALPVFAFYLAHAMGAPEGFGPTGFVQYEQLYYLANAREIVDRGGLFTYGNPFSSDYATAPIYFQPINVVFAAIFRLTEADPGLLYVLFGVLAVVACLRAIIALYQAAVPLQGLAAWLGLLLFACGGGLLESAGLIHISLFGGKDPFVFDPAGGSWFLNLGRNLVFPLEAFYHLLFLGAILAMLRRRWRTGLALAALLSASHPFTGIELLGILFGWVALERFLIGDRKVPVWLAPALLALLALHAAYYLLFLSLDPEHRSLYEKWRTYDAALEWPTILLAYGFVAGFALARLFPWPAARAVFAETRNRLFAVWFAGAFVLANNELLIDPIQPLHFTRGYIWTPLFLLGAPLLVQTLRGFFVRSGIVPKLSAAALSGLMLFDNAFWFGLIASLHPGIYLSPDERALFAWLSERGSRGELILANADLAYAATAYTPLRAWYSHPHNTPHALERRAELLDFLGSGRLPPGHETTPFLIVRDSLRDNNPQVLPSGRDLRLVYRNGTIAAWLVAPVAPLNPPPPSSRPPGSSAR